jgi:hypothetical protein
MLNYIKVVTLLILVVFSMGNVYASCSGKSKSACISAKSSNGGSCTWNDIRGCQS